MSSFEHPHRIYLFDLRSGKKKLAYGRSPEDALAVLRLRLSESEMEEVVEDRYIMIRQRDLARHVGELG